MKSVNEIRKVLQQILPQLREKYKLIEIGIFGSYVRGDETERSDIDVLVEFEEVPGLLKFLELEILLEEKLGVKVDLVRKKSIRKEFQNRILSEAIFL